jgi:tripartite-type tricarboxylate transporter receptor subunit TctC
MYTSRKLTRISRSIRALITLAIVVLALAPTIGAAAYPDKVINLIVAFPAGGGTDLVARALVPYLQKNLGGATIVVLNRPGAGGGIGFAALASAPADGYTIGFINTPNVLTIPIERKATFTWRSFDLLGNVVDDPGNFAVHADSEFKNLAQLVAYAKAKPGDVTVGTTGTGSDDHLAMLTFEKATGIKMTHIPFKGASDVRTALAGKQITVGAINIGEALQFAKGGVPLRNLGVMSATRASLAPDVPTFKEQGFDIVFASLRGLAAPKGLPSDIRDRLVKAVEQAVADPEFQATATQKLFAPIRYLPPAKYEVELRDGDAQFRKMWKELPWTDK